jgi:dolichol-phosphate mannosyltransferase
MTVDANAARPQRPMRDSVDLSIVIPARHEEANLRLLLPGLAAVLRELQVSCEILIVTGSDERAPLESAGLGDVRILEQTQRGYGGALLTGFSSSRGRYVLTMDADLSHPPAFISDLWRQRENAEVLIASRYVRGGSADMPLGRRALSLTLNQFFARGLSLPVKDLSSGFRLYRGDLIRELTLDGRDFNILQEILVRLYAKGWRTQEVPFHYAPRAEGTSNARVIPFGIAYLKTFWSLWKLRNSILSADYDDRAHHTIVLPQRYWQRQRYRHVTELIDTRKPVLDVGCGSSVIIGALPPGSVALDIALQKLRYARKFSRHLVQGSGFALPFRDGAFECVLSSQVIEHLPDDPRVLDELCRVLAPGGRLVLGTPDYGSWQWPAIEYVYGRVAPGAYADEHITHYSRDGLVEVFQKRGYVLEEERYILRAELILALRKPLEHESRARR